MFKQPILNVLNLDIIEFS